jgi:serine/threonine protein phosphatase 1
MSTIAVGDVHGNLAALDDLLNRITGEISTKDTIVFLGDYIDRGPDAKGCVQRIIDLRRTVKGSVVTLLGNHEEWLLRTYEDHTRHSWLLGMEAFQTIRSYSEAAAARLKDEATRAGLQLVLEHISLPYEVFFEAVPEEHLTFLTSLQTFCRTPDALCVHGGVNPDGGRVEEQRSVDLIWGTDGFPERYKGEEVVVYGHANNPVVDQEGWPHPRILGRTYGVDTISNGVLTALRLPEGIVFQSGRYAGV